MLSTCKPWLARIVSRTSHTADGNLMVFHLALAGEIDISGTDYLIAAVQEVVREHAPHRLYLDFREVTFADCAAIGALMRCRANVAAAGGTLTVVHPQPIVARLFRLSGCLEVLCGDVSGGRYGQRARPSSFPPASVR